MNEAVQGQIDGPTDAQNEPPPGAQGGPYRGILPFRYVDERLFFGRESTIEDLFAKVLVSRLVLLFGESQTGKSSVINAGLVPALERAGLTAERLRVRPNLQGPILVERIFRGSTLEEGFLPSTFADGTRGARTLSLSLEQFSEALRSKAGLETEADLEGAEPQMRPVLFFDQFEELFTLFGKDRSDPKRRLAEIKLLHQILNSIFEIVADHHLRTKIVLIIREDYLAKLDLLAKQYPHVFDYRVNLGFLTEAEATKAILSPFIDAPPKAPRLTEDLAKTIIRDLTLGGSEDTIHPTQLQIVCERLWDEFARPGLKIDVPDYKALEGVKGILEGFLRTKLDFLGPRRQQAILILGELITDFDTRAVVGKGKLKSSLESDPGWDDTAYQATLEVLEKYRLIGRTEQHDEDYYDVSSEYLIPAIKGERALIQRERDRSEREQAQMEELEARRKKLTRARRLTLVSLALMGIFLALAILTAVFWGRSVLARAQLDDAIEDLKRSQTELQKSNAELIQSQADLTATNTELEATGKRLAELNQALIENQAALQQAVTTLREQSAELEIANRKLLLREIELEQRNAALVKANKAAAAALEAEGIALKSEADALAKETEQRLQSVAKILAAHAVQSEPLDRWERAVAAMLALESYRIMLNNNGDREDPAVFSALWNAAKWLGDEWESTLELDTAVRALAVNPKKPASFAAGGEDGVVHYIDDWDALLKKREDVEGKRSQTERDRERGRLLTGLRLKTRLESGVRSLTFDPGGKSIAVGSFDGKIQRLALPEGNLLGSLEAHEAPVTAVLFSSDGQWFASADVSGEIVVWATSSWQEHATWSGPPVNSLAFDSDGKHLAAATTQGVRVLAVKSGERRLAETGLLGEPTTVDVRSVVWMGNRLARGGAGGGIELKGAIDELWDPLPIRHDARVTSLSVDSTGERLASASLDGTVRLWRVDAQTKPLPIAFTDHEGWVWSLAFADERQRLITGGADRTIRVLQTDADKLVKKICDALHTTEGKNVHLRDEVWQAHTGEPLERPYLTEELRGRYFPAGSGKGDDFKREKQWEVCDEEKTPKGGAR